MNLFIHLVAAVLLAEAVLTPQETSASFDHQFLLRRRQAEQGGESEKEATTSKPTSDQPSVQSPPASQQATNAPSFGHGTPKAGRLYPDLLRGNGPNFLPPFNGVPQHQQFGPAQFVPLGGQIPLQPPPIRPQPRLMTASERLQSQSFTNGLGKRLLSMVGIDTTNSSNQTAADADGAQPRQDGSMFFGRSNPLDQTRAALQNSTVLTELNKRVNLVMGGLSKMYNSTVQEQLTLLNERFMKETANSTNSWQQRVAQQVPLFFKQMAARVGQAQEQLNRVLRDVAQAAQGNSTFLNAERTSSDGKPPSFIDQIVNQRHGNDFGLFDQRNNGGDFIDSISRSLGMDGLNPDVSSPNFQNQQADLGLRLKNFWHTQVQPQVGMLRGQIARAWRDLSTSGTLVRPTIQQKSRSNENTSSSDLLDNVIKVLGDEKPEFTLIKLPEKDQDTTASASSALQSAPANNSNRILQFIPSMQDRLGEMQRDLNQLWLGLSVSLQNAAQNVRQALNPRLMLNRGIDEMRPDFVSQENDSAQNELDKKIKDLSRAQSEVNAIQDVIKQQERENQQRSSLSERFKGLMNNFDMHNLNQLPDKIGEQFNRFGAVVGNFWNTIPERWDSFMTNTKQAQEKARMTAQVAAAKTSTTPTSVES